MTDPQKQNIGCLTDELEIGPEIDVEMRARYLSNVLRREIANVGELSRGDASNVLQQLILDQESVARAAGVGNFGRVPVGVVGGTGGGGGGLAPTTLPLGDTVRGHFAENAEGSDTFIAVRFSYRCLVSVDVGPGVSVGSVIEVTLPG